MITHRRLVVAFALVTLVGAAIAQTVTCPIDKLSMMWTGSTRIEMGKMLYEYKCLHGHTTWIVK